MPTQYTPLLRAAKPVTGELSGTWGDVVNNNITTMLEQSIAGLAHIVMSGNYTLTTNDGVTDDARCAIIYATGTLTGNAYVIVPDTSKLYTVYNHTTGGFYITVATAVDATGVRVANGRRAQAIVMGSGGGGGVLSPDYVRDLVSESIETVDLATATLAASGAVSVGGNLGVDGSVSAAAVTAAGNVAGGTATISGAATVGSLTSAGAVSGTNVTASGTTTTVNLAVSGTATAPTASVSSNDTTVASTAFVKSVAGSLPEANGIGIAVSTTLTAAQVNMWAEVQTAGITVTLPALSSVPTGSTYTIKCVNNATLATTGGELITSVNGGSGTTYALTDGESLQVTSNGAGARWYITSAGFGSDSFSNLQAGSGYQKLPSGIVIQWGTQTGTVVADGTTGSVSFPIAFTTAVYSVVATIGVGASFVCVTGTSTSGYTYSVWNRTADDNTHSTHRWIAIGV